MGFLFVWGRPWAVSNASGGVLTYVPAARDYTQPAEFYPVMRPAIKLCLVTHLLSYVPQPDSATLSLARVVVPFIHSGHA